MGADNRCGMIRTGEVVAAGFFLFFVSSVFLFITAHILADYLFYLPICLAFFSWCFGYLVGRIPSED